MSLMVTSKRNPDESGYFRIGDVVLDIPPEEIMTNKIVNNEEITPLRAPYPFLEKTGHARWDATIHWKAIVDDSSGGKDYTQWLALRRILAMFKAAPFVEVENGHLRQLLAKDDVVNSWHSRMAFALRQLRVDVSTDLVDCLECTLTMCLFNYRPFSKDFAYLGQDLRPVGASNSPFFSKYLDDWVTNNLDTPYAGTDIDVTPHWDTQQEGTLWFKWREVVAMPLTPEQGVDLTVTQPLNKWRHAPGGQLDTDADYSSRLFWPWKIDKNNTAQIRALRNAIVKYESGGGVSDAGNPHAVSPTKCLGIMQWTSGSAIDTLRTMGGSYFQAAVQSGLLQQWNNGRLQWAGPNQYQSYYTWMNGNQTQTGLTSQQQLDMQNQMADTWITMKLQESNYDVDMTLLRHLGVYEFYSRYNNVRGPNGEPGYYSSAAGQAEARQWWKNVVGDFRNSIGDQTALAGSLPAQNVDPSTQASVPPVPATPVLTPPSQPSATTKDLSNQSVPTSAEMAAVSEMISAGWTPDHYTDVKAFLYWVHSMKMVDEEHNDSGPLIDMEPANIGLWPTSISVVFANNLAQLPLQDEIYPTYQHMGPATTMVSIGLTSLGRSRSDEEEPEHIGLSWLTDALSTLDNQYHNIHSLWRAASTNHKIQGIVLQNKVLNMLGIRGVLLDNLTTQTVKDSPSSVQAVLSAYQFENVYEDTVAYRVAGIGTLEFDLWMDLLAGTTNGQPSPNHKLFNGFRSSLNANEASQYASLFNLQDVLNSPTAASSQNDVLNYLTAGRGYLDDPGCRVIPMPSGVENNTLWTQNMGVTDPGTVLQQFPGLLELYPEVVQPMEAHVGLTYTDWFLLSRWITVQGATMFPSGAASVANYKSIANQIDTLISTQATNQNVQQPLSQLYEYYFNWKLRTDALLRSAMQNIEIMNNPLGQVFKSAINYGGPGRDAYNREHGAYRDLGLTPSSVVGLDNGPAYYFYDYSNEMKGAVGQNLASAVQRGIEAENAINEAFGFPGAVVNTGSVSITDQSKSKAERIQVASSLSAPLLGSMSRAFPAFKLFLVEENNDNVFYMLDNFFSYANVLDMEIIRYRDAPDTAILTITNKSHLLSHRLFDNTVAGRQERKDNKQLVNLPNSGPVIAPAGSQGGATINKTPNGFLEMTNLTDSLTNSKPGSPQRASPNWFALQTGSKVQVRLGFTNNPDELLPVFSGVVTDIQGDEILTVTAQGFMLELMSPAPDFMKRVGSGTWAARTGDAIGVMDTCLQSPYVKHFGHWLIGDTPNSYMKGFQWGEAIGSTFHALTKGRVRDLGSLLRQSYNRRNENLRIDRLINFDGSSTPQTIRPWFYEGHGISPPYYWVPDDPNITPWSVIQDIARRYPEYILAVRDYGFPYEVNATLVFLDPNEWYFSRKQLPGDLEARRAGNYSDDKFDDWWNNGGGKAKVAELLGVGNKVAFQSSATLASAVAMVMFGTNSAYPWVVSNPVVRNLLIGASPVAGALSALAKSIDSASMGGGATWKEPGDLIVDWISQGRGPSFDQFVDASQVVTSSAAIPFLESTISPVAPGLDINHTFESGVLGIQQDFLNWMRTRYKEFQTTLNDWMKPVRNWWFANRSVILDNAITRNDDVFNTVQLVGRDPVAVNNTIPQQYRHVLVADKMCINPNQNIKKQSRDIYNAYVASFLKEEIGKMYRGELVLLGSPEVKPHDVIIISDDWMGMHGPIEVDSVIHSFSQETGYITIVRPRALVATNDRVTAPIYTVLSDMWAGIAYDTGFTAQFSSPIGGAKNYSTDVAVSQKAIMVGGTSIATVGIGAIETVRWLFGCGGISDINPVIICPIERFGRPWFAGLQGFQVNSLLGVLKDRYNRFCQAELYPFIESWRLAEQQLLVITN